jgi:ATP-dependent Clp protease protease subunit
MTGILSGVPPTPPQVFAVFAGNIDQDAVRRVFQGVTAAISNKVGQLHLMMQSTGGFVGDGVCLYNFFRALPIDLTIYNSGSISSIAVVAYLGAKKRKVSTYASFSMHRSHTALQTANVSRLQSITKGLSVDDQRTEAILRQHLNLSGEQWQLHDTSDLWLTAQEALACGLADEIADFSPPPGTMVFNV